MTIFVMSVLQCMLNDVSDLKSLENLRIVVWNLIFNFFCSTAFRPKK